jgi:hypothetical protein
MSFSKPLSTQPLYYKPEDLSEETIKVSYTMNDGTTRKKQLKTFDGTLKGGLEQWCAAHMDFLNVCRQWHIQNNGAGKFEVYSQILTGTALANWNKLIDEDPSRSSDSFDQRVIDLVNAMYPGNPRNKASEYFVSEGVRKRRNGEVGVHFNRLCLLMRYHDLLPGTSPLLCDGSAEGDRLRRDILIGSFPVKWGMQFRLQVGDVSNIQNDQEILIFMVNKKDLMDASEIVKSDVRSRSGRGHAGPRHQGNFRGGRGGRQGRGFGNGRGFYNRPQLNYRPYPNYMNQQQGNFQGNRPFHQVPRYQPNNYRGGFGGSRNQQGRQGNRNHGYRGNPNQSGRGFPAQQHYMGESHFIQEAGNGFVPGGNNGGMPSDGTSAAGMQSAGSAQQQQHYFMNDNSMNDEQMNMNQNDELSYFYSDSSQYFDDSYYQANGDY